MVEIVSCFNQHHNTVSISFRSGDVSRLYTNIPLEDLKARLKALYLRLFSKFGPGLKVFLQRSKRNIAMWEPMLPPVEARTGGRSFNKYRIFSYADVCALIDLVIDNNYVHFGGRIFRQILGIAMGGNHSVYSANHYLFSYELEFYEQLQRAILAHPCDGILNDLPLDESAPSTSTSLVHHPGAVATFLLKQFLWFFRYIDDLSAFNNRFLHKLLYKTDTFFGFHGFYPRDIEITLTEPANYLNYLDIHISSVHADDKTPLHTSFYDKFSEPAFSNLPIIRYTHMSSNISLRIKRNILTGIFHRLFHNITNRHSFFQAMARAFLSLSRRGYSFHYLCRQLRSLCLRFDGLYGLTGRSLAFRILQQHQVLLMENSE